MTKHDSWSILRGVPGVFNAARYFEYHQYPGDEIGNRFSQKVYACNVYIVVLQVATSLAFISMNVNAADKPC